MMKAIFLSLLGALFLSACSDKPDADQGHIVVALWDTEICPNIKVAGVELAPLQDMTDDSSPTNESSLGQWCQERGSEFHRAIHAQYMLDTLAQELSAGKKIKIYPVKVFSNQGHTKPEYWQRAIVWANKRKHPIDLHVMGSALPLKSEEWQRWKEKLGRLGAPILAAAPTFGAGIDQTSKLWPQSLLSDQGIDAGQLSMIAGVHFNPAARAGLPPNEPKRGHFDPTIMLADQVEVAVQFPAESSPFRGNSWAVARLAGRFLNRCSPHEFKGLKACLGKLSSISIPFGQLSNNYSFMPFP